jgi:hypothetical protein
LCAKQLVSEGRIGAIRHFRGVYLQDWIVDPEFPRVWRLEKAKAGSGALGDIASHSLDLARHLVGEIAEVTGLMKTFITERPLPGAKGRGPVDVDDAALCLLRFENGAIGSVEGSRFAPGRKNHNRFEINGSKGSLVWDLERGRCIRIFRGHARQVTAVTCARAAAQAVSGDYGGGIRVWDVEAGGCVMQLGGHESRITALRISADGAWLLSASADHTLRVWRLQSGECVDILTGHGAPVLDADVSGDGRWALSVARDGGALVWDMAERRQAASFRIADSLDAVRVDFDGGSVSTVEQRTRATVWDIDWELEAPSTTTAWPTVECGVQLPHSTGLLIRARRHA